MIDNGEQFIMNHCLENSLTSKFDIENNLVGEWSLVGYGSSVFQDLPQPKINLTFSDSILIFENQDSDIIDTMHWEIEEIVRNNGSSFALKTASTRTSLRINRFCEDYMYIQTLGISSTIAYLYLYGKEK